MKVSFCYSIEKKKLDKSINATIFGKFEQQEKDYVFTPTHFFCNTEPNDIIGDTELTKRFNGSTWEADKSLKLDIPLKVDPKFLTVFADN